MEQFKTAFVKPVEFYKRNLNFYSRYVELAGSYISKLYNVTLEEAMAWVREKTLPGKECGIIDPTVTYLEQVSEGNRVMKTAKLSAYLKMVEERRYLMSPTMTAYRHPDDELSILGEYIDVGLKSRNANKKKKLHFKSIKNHLLANIYDNRQNRNKIKNNSLSGAQGTTSSVLFTKSAHSTLTSTCRSASSNTNANTERLLSGNRHFWSADIAINCIVTTIANTDFEKLQRVVDRYNLVYPSVHYTMRLINECTGLYWNDEYGTSRIYQLVKLLSPQERAAFCYSGDLASLALNNPELVRNLLDGLIILPTEPIADPKEKILMLGEDEVPLLSIVTNELHIGNKLWDDPVTKGPNYGLIGAMADKIMATMNEYADLFDVFWATKNVASSMATFPSSIRKVVVASDTDSCIFTNQQWVEWYVGDFDTNQERVFSQIGFSCQAATTYLASQMTSHVLAVMSGNMGVADQHMRLLQMKNEYAFKVFSLTSMAKHYYAPMVAQEGNIYDQPAWEIKGATLRNSTAPKALCALSDEFLQNCVETIMGGKKLVLKEVLQYIANLEWSIVKSIESAEPTFFNKANIKSSGSYKNANSPYLHYKMWTEVFAPKYGHIEEPPYVALTCKLSHANKTEFDAWIESWEDKEMSMRFKDWLTKNNKDLLGQLHLPADILIGRGLPVEVVPALGIRMQVKSLMKSFYLILESLGYYCMNEDITRLIMDEFPPTEIINIVKAA